MFCWLAQDRWNDEFKWYLNSQLKLHIKKWKDFYFQKLSIDCRELDRYLHTDLFFLDVQVNMAVSWFPMNW